MEISFTHHIIKEKSSTTNKLIRIVFIKQFKALIGKRLFEILIMKKESVTIQQDNPQNLLKLYSP